MNPPSPSSGPLEDLSREELFAEIQRLERFRADFLVLLAHEIRDPLWPVTNGLDLLERKGEENEIRSRVLGIMRRQVDRLLKLVDGLLEVSRVTYGRIPLQRQRVDLARLVREVEAAYRPVCDEAGVLLSVESPETPAWVQGDAIRLRQVVSVLVENACVFTDPGGSVEIRLKSDEKARQTELQVRDTGLGMEPAVLSNAFEPFSQADRVRDRRRGGLGLGLAMVRGLVRLHGGTIEAASEGLGKGSMFTVQLPLVGEAPVLTSLPDAPAAALKPCRVLVIEDNRDGSDTLRKLLEMAGYEVRVAYTGPEGVRLGIEWHPDVVLCDLGLPGLDGYGVADEFRRRSLASTARLIAVTGYGMPEDLERSKQHGFQAHVTKPADPVALLALLSQPRGN